MNAENLNTDYEQMPIEDLYHKLMGMEASKAKAILRELREDKLREISKLYTVTSSPQALITKSLLRQIDEAPEKLWANCPTTW